MEDIPGGLQNVNFEMSKRQRLCDLAWKYAATCTRGLARVIAPFDMCSAPSRCQVVTRPDDGIRDRGT